jgi:hypothetical protein
MCLILDRQKYRYQRLAPVVFALQRVSPKRGKSGGSRQGLATFWFSKAASRIALITYEESLKSPLAPGQISMPISRGASCDLRSKVRPSSAAIGS